MALFTAPTTPQADREVYIYARVAAASPQHPKLTFSPAALIIYLGQVRGEQGQGSPPESNCQVKVQIGTVVTRLDTSGRCRIDCSVLRPISPRQMRCARWSADYEGHSMCVCVRASVRACVRVCVCVCVFTVTFTDLIISSA